MSDLEIFKTKGTLSYPSFIVPRSYDNATNKFVEDLQGGSFGTGLIITKEDLKLIDEQFQKQFELFKESEKYKQLVKTGYIDILPENYYTETEDKKIELKFKRAAVNKQGKKAKIEFFDTYKNDLTIEQVEEIGNGTTARLIYTIYSWAMSKTDKNKSKYISFGITLCLLAVQVLDLKKSSSLKDFITDDEQDGNFKADKQVKYSDTDFSDDLISEEETPFKE